MADEEKEKSSELDDKQKQAEIKLKEQEFEHNDKKLHNDIQKLKDDEQKTLIDKVSSCRQLLDSISIDEEKTILGSEPILKNTFNSSETKIIKEKIFELLKRY